MAASHHFAGLFYNTTPNACLVDSTSPTFSGVSSITPNADGSLSVSWLAASDSTPPIRYHVYLKKGDSTSLFTDAYLVQITKNLTTRLYVDADLNLLEENATYYVGVRAMDAVGNIETNLVTLNDVVNNTLGGGTEYKAKAIFSISTDYMLKGSLYLEFEGRPLTSALGTASYQFYDESDVAIGSLTQSGITANGNGVFLITPVDASLLTAYTHYRVKVIISYDGDNYTSFWGITTGEGVG